MTGDAPQVAYVHWRVAGDYPFAGCGQPVPPGAGSAEGFELLPDKVTCPACRQRFADLYGAPAATP